MLDVVLVTTASGILEELDVDVILKGSMLAGQPYRQDSGFRGIYAVVVVVVAPNIELLRDDDDDEDVSASVGEMIIGEEIDVEEVIDVEIAVMVLRDVN